MSVNDQKVAVIVLAAGLSRRMGRPKMVLPWGKTVVIAQVVHVMLMAGVFEIVVVTGGARESTEAALKDLPVRLVFNPRYETDEMIYSLQTGLGALTRAAQATLVALGDQPRIELSVVRAILTAFQETDAQLVVPSYQMRRGHPWLVARPLWPALLSLQPPETIRTFFQQERRSIHFVSVETDSVVQDLDTPEDYEQQRPDISPMGSADAGFPPDEIPVNTDLHG